MTDRRTNRHNFYLQTRPLYKRSQVKTFKTETMTQSLTQRPDPILKMLAHLKQVFNWALPGQLVIQSSNGQDQYFCMNYHAHKHSRTNFFKLQDNLTKCTGDATFIVSTINVAICRKPPEKNDPNCKQFFRGGGFSESNQCCEKLSHVLINSASIVKHILPLIEFLEKK